MANAKRARPALSIAKAPDIELDGTDKQGKRRRFKLHARTLGERAYQRIRKQQDDGDDDGLSPDVAVSRAVEGEFHRLIRGKERTIILPPFDLRRLAGMREISPELGESIDAMVTNTVGFGFQLKERPFASDEIRARHAEAIAREKSELTARLSSVHPVDSMTRLMERMAEDKHATGNGYLELVDSQRGELVGLNHVHGHSIRLTEKDRRPTKIDVPVIRLDTFSVDERPAFYHFRRYVQIRNNRLVWFKEAGDPRQMDWRTGEFAKRGEEIPFSKRATALIHFNVYNPLTPYGVPVWIGATFSIFGSREAAEVNWVTIRNNSIPSMFVVVENGALTPESIERLEEWVEHQIQGSPNRSKFIILEGDTIDEGAPNPAQFRIRIEPLKSLQQSDELYQDYRKNNGEEVRKTFRLPPIFVGSSDEYNRATADTSRDIADEQVFAPERNRNDHPLNRFVLSRWGARFHQLVHNHPNITDDIELIRMAAIGERSGAVTPRRMDRIMTDIFGDGLGPMPKGIDLDVPYSLQFAQAQAGGSARGGMGGGDNAARGMINDLLDLRTKIEKELDRRFTVEVDDAA
jgi:PBSX family phage portal protein